MGRERLTVPDTVNGATRIPGASSSPGEIEEFLGVAARRIGYFFGGPAHDCGEALQNMGQKAGFIAPSTRFPGQVPWQQEGRIGFDQQAVER